MNRFWLLLLFVAGLMLLGLGVLLKLRPCFAARKATKVRSDPSPEAQDADTEGQNALTIEESS